MVVCALMKIIGTNWIRPTIMMLMATKNYATLLSLDLSQWPGPICSSSEGESYLTHILK